MHKSTTIAILVMFFSQHKTFAQSTMTATGDWISRMETLDRQMIIGLSGLELHVNEMAEIQQKIRIIQARYKKLTDNKDSRSHKDLYGRENDLITLFVSKFPATAYSDDAMIESPVASSIMKAVEASINKVRDTSAAFCFPGGASFNHDNAACQKQLASCNANTYWAAKNGMMHEVVLDQDLNTNKKELNKFEDILISTGPFKGLEALMTKQERDFVFCKIASLVGETYVPKAVVTPTQWPEWTYIPIDIFSDEGIHKNCVDGKPPADLAEKLYVLADQYPQDGVLQMRMEAVGKRLDDCNKAIMNACENCYVVKDKIILTYATVECKWRDVTREDIENDISTFRSAGSTEADILKHSTLLDKINLCQAASAARYSWPYKKPDLGSDCHKRTKRNE